MKRVSLILATVIVMMLMSCDLCPAQLNSVVGQEYWVGTSPQTITITAKDFIPVKLMITNESATDTLKWRTNNEATWKKIKPKRNIFLPGVYAKLIYMVSVSGTIHVNAWAY
jgi:hypothetical protein